ncbi:MAG: BPTD_3080 family restriction endonuclease [bacterium]
MSQFNEVAKPIINDPYEEPRQYYVIEKGEPPRLVEGRREACYYYRPPRRQTAAAQADDIGTRYTLDLVNDIRARVKAWREAGWPGVTSVTDELLRYWTRPEREGLQRLFFCQREAAETVIFLSEARTDLRQGLVVPRDEPSEEMKTKGYAGFVRYACKMATGSGKTTVMGMLAAWSILNKVADRGDARFSDIVLIVCPNVTIRDRLQELDPKQGEASLYRTRDIVPPHLMAELRKGPVLITNWHVLAPQELGQVGGVGAKVVNRGEESDTALCARVLGPRVGNKGNVLVMNDEAHHAYRLRQLDNTADVEEEDELAEMEQKEATVWVEGLDKLSRIRGINLCVDLSATPFYLNNTGNDPGRPFPWVVSDFGLVDAIESGLVKIPQLPIQDATGAAIPAYFNVWKWIVETKLTTAERGGRRGQVKPEAVLKWAQNPIAQLAGLWQEKFVEWEQEAAAGRRPPVPPVFIIVCKTTKLAKVIYEWIAEGKSETAPPIEEFRNRDGREYTVRVDSKVVEEMESGVAKSDESHRLRFVLSTIGKTHWPNGEVPAEYAALAEKINRKAAEEGGPQTDPMIPPGGDVRCIVSVAMLTEGWDATTVTHIVGLRPFESQLLCEQVVGRGLRRSQYHDLSVEEVAKVYGVPFELIPLKTSPTGPREPPPKVHHVKALSPERDHLEIRFPRVEGYTFRVKNRLRVDWSRVPILTLDPGVIPDETLVKGLSADQGGALSLMGPGRTEEVTLDAWRKGVRLQQVEFELARTLTRKFAEGGQCEVPSHVLFPQMLAAVRRCVREHVQPLGSRDRKDVFLNPYYGDVIERLVGAIVPDLEEGEAPELPRYEANRPAGSTRDVDFWTSKPVVECQRSHLNFAVADTQRWEQMAKFYLDRHQCVVSFVRNFNVGFAIPYLHNGEKKEYVADFLVRLRWKDKEVGTLILEVKGYDPLAEIKKAAALRWVSAVNNDRTYGLWDYRLIYEPTETNAAIQSAAEHLASL